MSWFSGLTPTPPVGLLGPAPVPASNPWGISAARLQNAGLSAPGTVVGSSSSIGHIVSTQAVQSIIATGLQPPVVNNGLTALAIEGGALNPFPPAPVDHTKLWIELGLAGAAAIGLVMLLRRRAA